MMKKRTAWNKGTKGICKPNKTSFKKGQKSSKKGRTYEEIYGKKKAQELRDKVGKKGRKLSEETKNKMKGRVPWNKGKKFPNFSGKNHPNWKGGKTITSDGYVAIATKGHPNAHLGYVLEHRLVMEKYLGRYLKSDEVVHHINGDKKDNRLENLGLMGVSEHMKHHRKNGKAKKLD